MQELVTDYNTKHARELFPHQEQHQRHLVKNSFIVELSEGQRKLRHLFLFNDVLVCAKYKASGSGNHPPTGGVAVGRHQEKFTFQLKWYIPLEHVSGFWFLKRPNPPNVGVGSKDILRVAYRALISLHHCSNFTQLFTKMNKAFFEPQGSFRNSVSIIGFLGTTFLRKNLSLRVKRFLPNPTLWNLLMVFIMILFTQMMSNHNTARGWSMADFWGPSKNSVLNWY